jgi:cytochrome c oxidase subunit 4
MSEGTRRILAMWRGPILAWIILVLLVVATFAASQSSLPATAKTVIQFGIVAVQVALIVIFFMNLRASPALLRFCAVAGLYWLAIMFVLTFNDYASRPLSSPCNEAAFSSASAGQCATRVR